MVVGLVALPGSFVPVLGLVLVPFALGGIALAVLGLGRVGSRGAGNTSAGVAGIVLNTVAAAVAVLLLASTLAADIESAADDGEATMSISADGSGLRTGNWAVQGDVVPTRDRFGDFTATFRVENLGDSSDAAWLTVGVLDDTIVLGRLECVSRVVDAGQVATARCVSYDPFVASWTRISLGPSLTEVNV